MYYLIFFPLRNDINSSMQLCLEVQQMGAYSKIVYLQYLFIDK